MFVRLQYYSGMGMEYYEEYAYCFDMSNLNSVEEAVDAIIDRLYIKGDSTVFDYTEGFRNEYSEDMYLLNSDGDMALLHYGQFALREVPYNIFMSQGGKKFISYLRETGEYIKLWEDFGDVLLNPETECLERSFYHFPCGTSRYDIWHWFEYTFECSVVDLVKRNF